MIQRSVFLHLIFILSATIIGYNQIALMQHTMKWDIMDQFFPVKYFFSECLEAGFIPFWNPYINLGYPFHADPQSGFYYPLTWLFGLTTGYNVYIMNLEFILHVMIAGTGMYQLLRGQKIRPQIALIFAIIFQFSGMFVSNATHLTWIISIAWIPYILHHYLHMVEEYDWKHALKFSFFLFLCLTGGYPVFTVILLYLLVIIFLVRLAINFKNGHYRGIKNLIVCNTIGFIAFALLASGYIYSFLQASPHIARGQALTVEVANSIPFTLKAMVSFVFPFALPADPGFYGTDQTMTNMYMGLLTLPLLFVFLFIKKNYLSISLAAFGLVAFLASLGPVTPVRTWLYHGLPLMDMFRHAAIFRTFTIVCLIVTAAYALNHLIRTNNHLRLVRVILVLMVLLLGVEAFNSFTTLMTFPADLRISTITRFNQEAGIRNHISIQAINQFIAIGLITLVFFVGKQSMEKRLGYLVLIVAIEMIAATQLNIAGTIASKESPAVLQSKLDRFPSGFPIPGEEKISTITSIGDGSLNPIWHNTSIFKKQVAKDGFNNFYLTNYEKLILSEDKKSAFANPFVFASDPTAQVTIKSFRPGEVLVKVTASSPTQLTLMQNDFPDWGVRLNGNLIAHSKKNHTLITADVPAGTHILEFKIKPGSKFFVLWLPLAGLVLFVIFLALPKFRIG